MKKNNTVRLCVCAAMAALYVGLDFLAVTLSAPFGGSMKISVSGLPVIISAVMFGPVFGCVTGFIGAFLGQMITYGFTATTLLWCLPAAIRGLLMGALFILFKRSIKNYFLIIETVISSLAVTAVNTFVMYVDAYVYKYPVTLFGIALVNRIIAGIVTAVLFAVILPPIIKVMKRYIKQQI